jgi:hypothetical protein
MSKSRELPRPSRTPFSMPTDFARRRLPHSYPENAWLFVTCHLNGSLPKNRYPPPGAPNAGKAFVWMDRYLDTARSGPRYLARDEIASLVANQLDEAQRQAHCDLGAYAILPNHIHLLFRPKIDPSRLLKSLKGTTARRANLILHLTGTSLCTRSPMTGGFGRAMSGAASRPTSKTTRSKLD